MTCRVLPEGARPVLPQASHWEALAVLFVGRCHHRWFPTDFLCRLSLLPQLGARCFPICRLLSRVSGPSGRTKLRRGFRNCLMRTRICIQVCTFLETVSKEGTCCLLSLDLPLRWPCWLCILPASPWGQPHILSLHIFSPPLPPLRSPLPQ